MNMRQPFRSILAAKTLLQAEVGGAAEEILQSSPKGYQGHLHRGL